MRVLLIGGALVVAACGSGDSEAETSVAPAETDVAAPPTDAPAPATAAPETEPTEPEPTEPVPTEPPPTSRPEVTTTTEPPPTSPPEATTTTEPPPAVSAVGLVPLPGAQLDFAGQPAERQSLVWSLYSGSGGVIVEHIGGSVPPGCHGTAFFDPVTFDLLQIDGADAQAYAELGEGSCDGMAMDDVVIDGDAVAVKQDDLIVFDFGGLPPGSFDVSTQLVDPGGANGTFRAGDALTDPLTVNDLADASHVVGATGIFERDPSTGRLARLEQPVAAAGAGCDETTVCLQNGRFEVEVVDALGSPGLANVSDETGAAFSFTERDRIDVVMSVLNACGLNDHYWVFAASAHNIEFTITVTDTLDESSESYVHPLGDNAEPVLDTNAFATCP